jgi:dihydroorotate dehydrogenase electron transfer subunit
MKAKIISNSCVTGPYYKLFLKPLNPVKSAPGQFLMIRQGTSYSPSDPLLPRPFSIHRATAEGHIEVLYKRVGKGNAILASLSAEEEVEILGPLGNGFTLDGIAAAGEVVVAAGGIGVAPMLGLVEAIRADYPEKEIRVFLGGRGEVDLLCVE